MNSRRLVLISLFVAQGLVLSLLESLLPTNFILPTIKPGLANIVTIVALHFFSIKDVLLITFCRSLLASFFSGNLFMFFFSFVGGVLSVFGMGIIIKKFNKYFSEIGASIVGAFLHNLGQLAVASFILKDSSVFLLLPIALLSSLVTGSITGYLSKHLLKIFDRENRGRFFV